MRSTTRISLRGCLVGLLLTNAAAAQDPPAAAPQAPAPQTPAQSAAPDAADPFATTDAMLNEGGRQGGAAGRAMPVVVLHGFLEMEGRPPAALVSIAGTRPRLVRRGDVVSVQPGATRRSAVARTRPPARTRNEREADDADEGGSAQPIHRAPPAPGNAAAGPVAVLVIEVLEVEDGSVVLRVQGTDQTLTVQR